MLTETTADVERQVDSAFAGFEVIVAAIADPKKSAAVLRALKGRLSKLNADIAVIDAEEKLIGEHEQATSRLEAELKDLRLRLIAVSEKRGPIDVRREKHRELYARWRNFAEAPSVGSGFRDPTMDALRKAKIAYGLEQMPEPEATNDPHYSQTVVTDESWGGEQLRNGLTRSVHVEPCGESPAVRRRRREAALGRAGM